MSQVIIVRIVPSKATSGAAFTAFLANLSIRAFDLSFGDPLTGTLVGTAQGAWIPDTGLDAVGPAFTPATQRLLQHATAYPVQVLPLPAPPDPDVRLEAVATAVIELAPPPATEFGTPDLRLEIRQGTQLVAYQRLDFNVKVEPDAPISNNPSVYTSVDPPAVVLALPDPSVALDPNAAFVALPTDGSPPPFAPLRTAIDKVLAQDPGAGAALADRSPLGAPQARQVAREIVWNRSVAPPPSRPNGRRLEDLYTRPQTDTSWSDDDRDKADMDRQQYEASLLGYYALQDANSDRLAQFVFAASAAVWAEQQSAAPGRVALAFPVETGVPPVPGATFQQAEVDVEDAGGLTLDFRVPAPYFYALSAVLATNVTADQRYRMATDDDEDRLAASIAAAIDTSVIVADPISPANASRRLVAIGRGLQQRPALCPLDAAVDALVAAWLADMGPSIDPFWQQAPFPPALVPGHLALVLAVVTRQTEVTPDSTALIAAIEALPVTTVAQLKALTVQDWTTFFLPTRAALLPAFTKPGTPEERVQAFVRQVRKYFDVVSVAPAPLAGTTSGAPMFPVADDDPFAAFLAAAPGFAFPVADWTVPLVVDALQAVFPGDAEAQAWLLDALRTLDELLRATAGVGPASLQFSLLEALHARGFTARAQIQALAPAEFEFALTGTVAYPYADAIQAAAGGSTAGTAPTTNGPFAPVNPDGTLVDCLPPWHLSPLGPAAYLQQMLACGAGTTCDHPAATGATLGDAVAPRRGPLGNLQVTAANVRTRLPLVDIVNENLEALVDGSTGGVVHDTNATSVGGHLLRPPGASEAPGHAPDMLFAALPEFSTPATPVARPGAYATLAADFSSPLLPYTQPLDISRSYLCALGTSRFATMRTFRADITEFALDASREATDFQKQLWRYPVRLELAIEALGLSAAEYSTLYVDAIDAEALRAMYGFAADTVDGIDWKTIVVRVPEFLRRTGLQYCEFLELWTSGFIAFDAQSGASPTGGREPVEQPPSPRGFSDCPPCCPDDLVLHFVDPADPEDALRRLMIFIRLWRSLRCLPGARYGFADLRDICLVLGLFVGGVVDSGFVRRLAAFQVLRDDWRLDLGTDETTPGATGAARTRLLGLWSGAPGASVDWAVDHLLGRIEDRAEREHAPGRLPGSHRRHRPPEFIKVLRDNLEILALLGGFDPAVARWDASPPCTLRFAEILGKIYQSHFTTGELLFLFSVDQHLDGEDPFFAQDANEALDQPFDFPEEGHPFDLWTLRRALLEVHVDDAEVEALDWHGITAAMHAEFGPEDAAGAQALLALGGHFFPETLARAGQGGAPQSRQYRVPLAATVAGMWNFPLPTPFRYDATTQELVASLPLREADVLAKLNAIEQLTADEAAAVQQLVFAPRAELARFSFLFPSLAEAERALVEEGDEAVRWRYFRHAFLRFARRARRVAEHLAGHVAHATDHQPVDVALAAAILRSLAGDENLALTPWEQDAAPPTDFAWPRPTGGAFAALVRLVGTGLLGEVRGAGGATWPEMRGPTVAFAPAADDWNVPVATIVPRLDLALPTTPPDFALVRNGLALRDADGHPLAGAEGFTASWSGVLIVEHPGTYTFFAGGPTPAGERPHFEHCNHERWRVNLRRGQKTFRLLNWRWADEQAPDRVSGPLHLKRGAYFIDIDFEETARRFDEPHELARARTGFVVKYQGPDTAECVDRLPMERLYRDVSTGPLASPDARAPAAVDFLSLQYTGSLRDIRRTYQRAFKALLLCHRLRLSAARVPRPNVSEIEYMLATPAGFAGWSYLEGTPFTSHRAFLDFNLLPVGDAWLGDPRRQPPAALDTRAAPSTPRRQALFDWFERLHDYTRMRRESRLAWLCFVDASNQQPTDPVPLLSHLGVDLGDAPLTLRYHDGVTVDWTMLGDDRLALRCWHAGHWVRALRAAFVPLDLAKAQPDVWAADALATMGLANANLTQSFRDGAIERVPARHADLERLNDLLRERGRQALLAWLTGMDRVPLPFAPGTFATHARDIGALLLLDVEAGLCQRASRVEEAITAVQTFVERARLSREPGFVVTAAFASAWDGMFAAMRPWQACRRRTLYRENVVEWDEHALALRTEAFRFLDSELRRHTLTAPEPGGLAYWPGEGWPGSPGLVALQHREPSHLRQVAQPENLGLMGRPARHGRPSWLAPSQRLIANGVPGGNPAPGDPTRPGGPNGGNDPDDPNGPNGPNGPNNPNGPTNPRLAARASAVGTGGSSTDSTASPFPLWLQAAVRLGTRFLRIAAAGEPSAWSRFAPPPSGQPTCCCDCGRVHPPVTDEYYFWLVDSEYHDPTRLNPADPTLFQDADWGATTDDATSDWNRADQLPKLLAWPTRPMVKLAWVRVHDGEFDTPRQSDDGAHVDPTIAGQPQLVFAGRSGDSLRFSITNADAPPPGFADPSPWGFRYDLPTDTAAVLPEVIATPVPTGPFPPSLSAYPFFVWCQPGAPLEPSVYATSMTVAAALRLHCRHEAALKWYELTFAPGEHDLRWSTCRQARRGNGAPQASQGSHDPQDACCDTLVKTEPAARERSVLLAYLETLLQHAKAAACRPSQEALAIVRLRLETLAGLLGERPRTIQGQDDDPTPMTVAAFVPRQPPLNPRLMALYDDLAEQLEALHRCLTPARLSSADQRRAASYWGDDPTRRGWQEAFGDCEADDGCCCPPSPYRFQFLMQRALETAGEVRLFGSELLAAFEKGDAEFLAAMRVRHERQLLDLTEEIRRLEFREADWQVQALQKTKEAQQARRQYYADLIANGLIPKEQAFQNLTGVSMTTRAAGNVVEAVGQMMNLIPDNTTGVAGIAGTPVSVFRLPIGTKLAHVFAAGARILFTVADISGTQASLSLTEGGWDRREADWVFQVTVLDIEIEQVERLILGAQRRRDVALRQLDNLVQQKQQSAEVHEFLRDKFSSHALYLFLQQETAALHRQMADIAWCWARQAQRAYRLERELTTASFLPPDAWDGLHEGLLAGERLSVALRTMEKSYLDQNRREQELVTRLSLRLDFPLAFLELQATGACTFDIPEWRLDREYPGHYLRRIKSVALTIPCVAGPYTGVHCRLTLLSSATRVEPTLLDVEDCCAGRCTCGCCDRRRYEAIPDDPRIVRRYGATEAIATSSGQNDAGLFELSFRDERYLPFEYAGAVSRWRLELPVETNAFDVDTLGDVVFQLSYTAREGGTPLRDAAWAVASCLLPGAGLRYFDWRQDFSDAWQRFQMLAPSHEYGHGHEHHHHQEHHHEHHHEHEHHHHRDGRRDLDGECRPRALGWRLSRGMFPYLPGRRPVRMRRVELWFEAQAQAGVGNHEIEFVPARGVDCDDEDGPGCERWFLTCVASEDWPCLFHGVLDYPFPFLRDDRPVAIGDFVFPAGVGIVHRVCLVCSYEAGPPARCLPRSPPSCESRCEDVC